MIISWPVLRVCTMSRYWLGCVPIVLKEEGQLLKEVKWEDSFLGEQFIQGHIGMVPCISGNNKLSSLCCRGSIESLHCSQTHERIAKHHLSHYFCWSYTVKVHYSTTLVCCTVYSKDRVKLRGKMDYPSRIVSFAYHLDSTYGKSWIKQFEWDFKAP